MAKSWTVHLVRAPQSEELDGGIVFHSGQPTRGWIKFRIRIDNQSSFKGNLHYDAGRGFRPEQVIQFAFVDGVAEQIVFIPQTAEKFQLDLSANNQVMQIDVAARAVHRLGVTYNALRRNLRMALRGNARRKPSILIGLKLLATGQFPLFFRQLRVNANPESIEEKQYENWMRRQERLQERINHFALRRESERGRIFSIILIGNNDSESINRTIGSVLRQTYGNWELWITTNAAHVRDPRIKTMHADSMATAATMLNAALDNVTGEYLLMIEEGDELAPHALDVVADTLHSQPALDFIYSDEDVIDATGMRRDAFFKPDWSPEHLLGAMYTGQLAIYRTALVRQLGGFRNDRGYAYDYDLALRITEQSAAIAHVPEILYHRRFGFQRDRAADRRAVENHLQCRGRDAAVEPSPHGESHAVQYSLLVRPVVSVLMASACRPMDIPQKYWALNSLTTIRQKATYGRIELILLTPAEIDPQLERALAALGVIRSAYEQPFNFSAATNQAASLSQGEHLLLLNDDTELISPDFIERMLAFSQQPAIGAVGAKLLYADGTIQHAGIVMPACSPGHPFHDKPRQHGGYHGLAQVHCNYSAVTAACMMTRRTVFTELKGFDESFHMNYNDVDYCLRAIQKGYRIVYQPAAELYHHESMSKPPIQRSELRAFQQRWASFYAHDPFYNRNFRPDDCEYVLRG